MCRAGYVKLVARSIWISGNTLRVEGLVTFSFLVLMFGLWLIPFVVGAGVVALAQLVKDERRRFLATIAALVVLGLGVLFSYAKLRDQGPWVP